MKPFSRNELITVFLILAITFLLTFYNLQTAVRRSRDVQRREDLGAISDALHKFQENFGYFPPSVDGKIKMCKGQSFEEVVEKIRKQDKFDSNLYFEGLRGCEWGEDSFRDLLDESFEPYLKIIPADPEKAKGFSYYYLSNSKRFQLFAYLEGEREEIGFNQGIVGRNLFCGVKVCNFGKAFSETPLDKSIEKYEEELLEKSRTGNF